MLNFGIFLILTLTQGASLPPPGDSLPWFMIHTAKIFTAEGDVQEYPRIVFDGENFIIIWMDKRMNGNAIWAARINSEGVIIDSLGKLIERPPPRFLFYELVCATSGNNTLVVWEQAIATTGKILAKRIDRDLRVLDSIPISISDSAFFPRVTFNGEYYFITWMSGDGEKDLTPLVNLKTPHQYFFMNHRIILMTFKLQPMAQIAS